MNQGTQISWHHLDNIKCPNRRHNCGYNRYSVSSKDLRLSLSSQLAFGIGQFAEGARRIGFNFFILFFYNQVLGLSGTLVGAALFVALIADAAVGPLAGSRSDNWDSPRGRRHPFMYASALPLAAGYVALFLPPSSLGRWWLFAWLVAFAVIARGAMTVYQVPHMALGAELTESRDGRTRLFALRELFGTLGTAAGVVIGLGYFFSESRGGRLVAENYPPFALVIGGLMLIAALYSAWGTQKAVRPIPLSMPASGESALGRFVTDLRTAFVTRSFRWLCLCVVLVCVFVGTVDALELYAYQYFWELGANGMMVLQITFLVGLLVGVPVCEPVLRLLDKRSSVMLSIGGAVISHLAPVALRLLDALPENGDPTLMPILVAFRITEGICVQHTTIAVGSMVADVADEQEYITGLRQEGVLFGMLFFGFKTTSGVGQLIAGVGLDVIAWPVGPQIKTVAELPAGLVFKLGVLFGPVVAAIAFIAIACISRYGLTSDRHAQVLRELRERRGSTADRAGRRTISDGPDAA